MKIDCNSNSIYRLILLTSFFFLASCKANYVFKNLRAKKVNEVVFDMNRYGMNITASIKGKDSIHDFIKDLKQSGPGEFNSCCCYWDEIIIKGDQKDYVLKTNGKIFMVDSINRFYKLNKKYIGYWDGYEKCP